MLTSSSVYSTQCSTDIYEIYEIHSTNELRQKIQSCGKTQFTGQLDLEILEAADQKWSLFFHQGYLFGSKCSIHPIRRWCRQLAQYCPSLSHRLVNGSQQYWDEAALARLVQQGKVAYGQMAAVVEGSLVEVLFDMIQFCEQHRYQSGVRLTYRELPAKQLSARSVLIQVDRVWQQANHDWQVWQQSRLSHWSPNWAPVIWDIEELRRQTSLLAYHNLTKMVNGDRSLRDIAVALKHPTVALAQSIQPYVQRGIIGLVNIGDLSCGSASPPQANRPVQVQSSSPLIAYIEDSRFDCIMMGQILSQAGYRFINVREPVQALPILLEQKPSLIFLDLLMPVTNGYEVCNQIRRVSLFQDTPVIIVTSSDGIVDRVRAKLAGSSGFIAKPIEPDKVLSVLRSYLPAAC